MDTRLESPFLALRLGIGLTAALAGLDKFFNLLANWASYVSPLIARFVPFSTGTLMSFVGVIELAVGVAILIGSTRVGAYIACAWLALIAANLVVAGFYDIAVRDLVMSIAAFTLARMAEVSAPAHAVNHITASAQRVGA
jgi:uncharacterized membrane protein YphA (DoxX/SURF4 family)